MVTLENYEEFMIMYADGELSEAGAAALHLFIGQHPELASELEMYQSTHLIPDESLVLPNKQLLLKTEIVAKPGRRIALGSWVAYGAAASVAAVLIFFAVTRRSGNPNTMAVNQPVKTGNTQATHPAAQSFTPINNQPVIASNQPVNVPTIIAKKKPVKNKQKAAIPATLTTQTDVAIARIQVQPAQPLPVTTSNITDIQPIAIVQPQPTTTANIAVTQTKEDSKDLLALLPIDENKKHSLETIKNAVVSGISQAKNLKNDLQQSDITLKIGNRSVLNF